MKQDSSCELYRLIARLMPFSSVSFEITRTPSNIVYNFKDLLRSESCILECTDTLSAGPCHLGDSANRWQRWTDPFGRFFPHQSLLTVRVAMRDEETTGSTPFNNEKSRWLLRNYLHIFSTHSIKSSKSQWSRWEVARVNLIYHRLFEFLWKSSALDRPLHLIWDDLKLKPTSFAEV